MSGQTWRLTVYTDPETHGGVATFATHFKAPTIEAARQRAQDDASGRGPFTLEPFCPICDRLIPIGAPLHLERGSGYAGDVYTHPRCARSAARS